MFVSRSCSRGPDLETLDELRENVREHGGALIEYYRVWSFLLVAEMSRRVERVPPGKSRLRAGLKHVAYLFALGWWSIGGFFLTPAAIINNLMGGIDVTDVLTERLPTDRVRYPGGARFELERARKRQQSVFLVYLLALLVLIVLVLWVIPALM